MFGLIGDRLRKLLDGTSRAAVGDAAAATGRRPQLLEMNGSNGSTDKGLSNNNDSATEAVASSDCHSLAIDPVKLKEAPKEAPGATQPRGDQQLAN
jgi:hypothetical protein